jgi:hypothetical protein
MQLGDLDRLRSEVDARDLRAAAGHGFAQQAAAAAHVERALAGQAGAAVNVVESYRIQCVQRTSFPVRIPPALRDGFEARDLLRIVINRRVDRLGHGEPCRLP